jgi:IclR family transcriptional regulator, acetate operon repressor
MAVKRIRGATRALDVLEAIAAQQPVNVAVLARHLGENKSNIQRVLMTLSDDGWIRTVAGTPTRWELTARIYSLVDMGQGHSELRHLARPTLDRLRADTGESVFLAIPDRGRLVTIDVLESTQLVRTVPYIGMIIPSRDSAAGRAVLAHLPAEAQPGLLGHSPDDELLEDLVRIRNRGYSLSDGAVVSGSTNIGGAILDAMARPIAAIVVCALSDRMPAKIRERVGGLVRDAVERLSRSMSASRPSLAVA